MKVAPDGLRLPWHRVVNARGEISFPPGSRPYRLQREKLEQEGVRFRNGRVDLASHEMTDDLDALLWRPRRD